MSTTSRLFEPLKIGNLTLSHRVGLSPLTRYRASDDHVPLEFVKDYYEQRASVPGTLLITEGTFISPGDGGHPNAPGIYNQNQIDAWKEITDAVHAKGSYIFCQLWALGRDVYADVAAAEGIKIVSSGDIGLDDERRPTPLTTDEIQARVRNYATAAKNAIAAGFDGVELHGANGYLIDQFLSDRTNNRNDEYGGSVERRSRFAVEAVTAVRDAVGAERTGLRLSPWSDYNHMRMDDPVPQFTDVIRRVNQLGIAYVHLIESRVHGNVDSEGSESLAFAFKEFDGPVLVAGGFTPELARQVVDKEFPEKNIVIMFWRYFISTPDLPFRIRKGLIPNPYNRETFYAPKTKSGYIYYPFSPEFSREIGGVTA
ncbi:hypothetical protein KVR01_004466 [Diaporthe batatas]|uniref:uncharacterized protein n=1 Tax=Diaporthe batatas TaxID=748121 RepID=UPI001D05804A|nr:uncharacterized protein KVR01_004466 [Diaporthe batatas]KAG8165914.1 hypothetical protein KVR01_004466 [Diaporthe batatas]